jgi:L,D-peptidoglycan transpeptidase YkuD (ErfK/YbiS/YcfS/YnhG family)
MDEVLPVKTPDRKVPAILSTLPRRSRQVLVVKADPPGGSLAGITAWELVSGNWGAVYPPIPAAIGRSGLISAGEKTEGDGCTPIGVYVLGLTFGSEPSAPTAMNYRQAREDDFWVDDPASPEYNRWVSGVPNAASFERMLRPDGLYKYGIVIEYNTGPVLAGKGSAIFVHLWRAAGEPTSGCVAMAEASLLKLLSWLDPDKQPLIVLGDTE